MTPLTEILPNVFAVPIPNDASDIDIFFDEVGKHNVVSGDSKDNGGYMFYRALPTGGQYTILFQSKEAGEEDCKKVMVKDKYKDYWGWCNSNGGCVFYDTALNALNSLLISKGLNPTDNYLIIKKEK